MVSGRQVAWGVVGVIVATLLASGAVFGASDADPGTQGEIGDGDASAAVESLPTEQLKIDRGRFGTGVLYLRVPDARVSVTDVRETPRLVYRVEIPDLNVDETATRTLRAGQTRTVTLSGTDVAFEPGSVDSGSYDATVSIRVQSFQVDRTILSSNESVQVTR